MDMGRRGLEWLGIVLFLSIAGPISTVVGAESAYLSAVRTFADNVLTLGRDTYGPQHTPLLIDGINIDTHEPATWVLPEDCATVWKMPRKSVMCNVASQQNLFRTLVALSTLTGEVRYRKTAEDATGYLLTHLQHRDGLLYWGGHCMIDLATERVVGESHKDWTRGVPIPATWEVGTAHELKFHFPYYELMWAADADSMRQYIQGMWWGHVQNWANLDMNRHAYYGRSVERTWKAKYEGGPVPFDGKGLSFILTGSDLIYAAAMLSRFDHDDQPMIWAKRLAERYNAMRDPTTGLSGDIYAYYKNARLMKEFRPEFGTRASEPTMAALYGGRYGREVLCLLKLAEQLGDEGEPFRQLALADLRAFGKHAYDAKGQCFQPMLIDGTPIGPESLKNPKGGWARLLQPRPVEALHVWAYALGARQTNDPFLWEMTGKLGRAFDLGELGGPGRSPAPNLQTEAADPMLIFALLEMHQATKNPAYLKLARQIGDNLLKREFHKGFFITNPASRYAKFDNVTPLALLYLEAAGRPEPVDLPIYMGGKSKFHCDYEGVGRTYDNRIIYQID